MAPAAITQTPSRVYILTAKDRCDGCGARAYFRATLTSGQTLLFCYHHGLKHLEAIAPKISGWLDETDQLFDQK